MKTKVELNNWIRKRHFDFFNQFDEPYHGVTFQVDCTKAYQWVKLNNVSFFLYYLYRSLSVSQVIGEFKLRIEDNEVYSYDQIDAGSTIPRLNGTFGFGDFKYYPDFGNFHIKALEVIRRVEKASELEFSPATNIIRYSALPWIDFTALSHARMFALKDSCPKISFGKMTDMNGKKQCRFPYMCITP